MKRFFILASAAIVAFASCAKTEVVYNEAPQEIGFKAVTGSITKVEQSSGALSGDMGVIANLTTGAAYFGNTQFVYNSTDENWSCADPKYWPVDENKLSFAVSTLLLY